MISALSWSSGTNCSKAFSNEVAVLYPHPPLLPSSQGPHCSAWKSTLFLISFYLFKLYFFPFLLLFYFICIFKIKTFLIFFFFLCFLVCYFVCLFVCLGVFFLSFSLPCVCVSTWYLWLVYEKHRLHAVDVQHLSRRRNIQTSNIYLYL